MALKALPCETREMKIYQVSESLNNLIPSSQILGRSNISMPSGEVFECLSLNYKFHTEHPDEKKVEHLCKFNS